MKKKEILLLILILLAAFLVRLYRFDFPIADWHSWRQADTSAVSRNFAKNGFDILHPRFDDLSNVGSGFDNPQGYRFVEFPIYNIAQAASFKFIGILSLEEWGRLVSIFSSILTIIFLYLIVSKYKSKTAAFFTASFYAFLPFNIYFNRTILPDTSMVMAIMGGIYFFDQWVSSSVILKPKVEESQVKSRSFASLRMTILLVLSIIFTASAFLLKPYALFFTLPIIYLVFKNFGLGFIKKWQIWVFAILTILPLVFWRNWITQFPQGIPVSDWLFNGGNVRFTPSFFRWILWERITKLILGYVGLPLLILGIFSSIFRDNKINIPFSIKFDNFQFSIFNFQINTRIINLKFKNNQESLFFLSFLFSSVIYVFTMARGNLQHDYYQILIIPTLAIYFGLGFEFLFKTARKHALAPVSYILLALCCILMFYFSWYVVRDFFNINNNSMIIAGKTIDNLTPKNAKIIAPYDGDTSFLYQTKRKGWASFEKSLPEMITMGADYLVYLNTKKEDYETGKIYKIVAVSPEYIIFDLHKKP